MELKDSRYGNKMDNYLESLINAIDRTIEEINSDEPVSAISKMQNIESLVKGQKMLIDILISRLEECEERLNYPAGRTKRFFEEELNELKKKYSPQWAKEMMEKFINNNKERNEKMMGYTCEVCNGTGIINYDSDLSRIEQEQCPHCESGVIYESEN